MLQLVVLWWRLVLVEALDERGEVDGRLKMLHRDHCQQQSDRHEPARLLDRHQECSHLSDCLRTLVVH